MGNFANVFKKLRLSMGLTQEELASKLNISRSRIGMYETGSREPDFETLELIADFFNVDMDYLLGRTEKTSFLPETIGSYLKSKGPVSSIRVPVLGSVPAGIPIEAIEDIIDYEEIPSSMAEKGDYFALKIKGHSMEPQIMDGDVVIVLRTDDVDSGDIAIVMVNGDDATCKKVVKQSSGVQLVPINPDFDPLFFTNEEIASKPVRVIGRVSEIRRTL